jgi:hypothetical protein
VRLGPKLAACAGVNAGVALMAFGLPAIADSISPQRLVPAGVRLDVGSGVSVVPGPRTSVDARGTSPSSNIVLLHIGGIDCQIQANPFSGTLGDLNDLARRTVADKRGPQALGPEVRVRTTQGVPGLAAQVVAGDDSGWYEVYVAAGVGVFVQVTGSDAALVSHSDDIDRVLATLRFGAGS